MAFEYVSSPPEFKERLNEIFSDEFMRSETNFADFEDFKSSSAVFVNWKSDLMVYNEDTLDQFVKESTKFSSWEEMVCTAAERAYKKPD